MRWFSQAYGPLHNMGSYLGWWENISSSQIVLFDVALVWLAIEYRYFNTVNFNSFLKNKNTNHTSSGLAVFVQPYKFSGALLVVQICPWKLLPPPQKKTRPPPPPPPLPPTLKIFRAPFCCPNFPREPVPPPPKKTPPPRNFPVYKRWWFLYLKSII
jgi:hypothetical protein